MRVYDLGASPNQASPADLDQLRANSQLPPQHLKGLVCGSELISVWFARFGRQAPDQVPDYLHSGVTSRV